MFVSFTASYEYSRQLCDELVRMVHIQILQNTVLRWLPKVDFNFIPFVNDRY